MPKLLILRSRETVNMASDYIVFIDGDEAGRLKRGKKLEIQVSKGKHVLEARMEDYSRQPFPISLQKDTVLKLGSFRFNSFILPSIGLLVPLFYFLRSEMGISAWWGVLCVSPVIGVAFYFHFLRRDLYLRYYPKR